MRKAKALPRRFELSGEDLPYYYDDEYISNGCFLVSRRIIAAIKNECNKVST